MKKFRIIDMNIFEVWVIATRSKLEGRNCDQSTKILYSEYYSADYASKTASYEKMIHTDCLRLVESVDFDIKIVSIQDRMQKLRLLQDAATAEGGSTAPISGSTAKR